MDHQSITLIFPAGFHKSLSFRCIISKGINVPKALITRQDFQAEARTSSTSGAMAIVILPARKSSARTRRSSSSVETTALHDFRVSIGVSIGVSLTCSSTAPAETGEGAPKVADRVPASGLAMPGSTFITTSVDSIVVFVRSRDGRDHHVREGEQWARMPTDEVGPRFNISFPFDWNHLPSIGATVKNLEQQPPRKIKVHNLMNLMNQQVLCSALLAFAAVD
ncbi:hypothetical protein V2J09_016598 [Rumex salicifolius]